MNNKELIALFVELSENRSKVYDEGQVQRRAIQDEFNALLKTEYRKIHPRGNFTHTAKQRAEIANYEELLKPFMARAEAIGEKERKRYREIGDELLAVASRIVITDDMKFGSSQKSQWSLYGGASTTDFRSQGFGASKYARASAESQLDHVTCCGVEAEIRVISGEPTYSCGYSMETISFEVYAGCSPATCEIVRKKGGLSLREIVKRSWKNGVNPRVSMPTLPPDYERSVGLDYFGNDVKEYLK